MNKILTTLHIIQVKGDYGNLILTIFGMLVKIWEVSNMHIEIYSFMIWWFISEAEAMDASLLNYEFELITDLVTRIMDLIAFRIFNLPWINIEPAL